MLRFVLSAVVCLFGCVANAQTPFPARFVESGQVVTVPKGNYTMSQQVVVRAGGKLVIEAGSVIKVAGLGLPIQVYGVLQVNGTAAEPVSMGPDASGICGTIQTYGSAGARSAIQASYFDLTTTRNSNSLFLSFCDFELVGCKITNKSTTASRVCLALANASKGIVSSSFIDGCNDQLATRSTGVSLASGATAIDLLETIIANTTDPMKISKQFVLVSGSIE